MKFTNNHQLPESIYDAISVVPDRNKRRENANISVNELIGPPRIFQLMEKFGDQVEVDISERIHALMGSAVHEYISRRSSGRSDLRLHSQWMGSERSWIVSGEIDAIDENDILLDYKFCRVKAMADGIRPEWEAQLNCYNKLAEENGIFVAEMKIVTFYSDWNRSSTYREPGYPVLPVMAHNVRMWSTDSASAYVQVRLTEHERNFPLCSREERWADPDRWALMREDRKSAIRLYETEHEAHFQLDLRRRSMPDVAWYIQHRPSESRRCKQYCPVWQFCDFGQREHGTDKPREMEGPP